MSIADIQRRISSLETELARLQHRVPVRLGQAPGGPQTIIIIGGQTLATFNGITTYGIKRFAGTLSGITTQTYDPGTVSATTGAQTGAPSPAITAWPNGIGFGTMWDGAEYTRVIVCNDQRGGAATAMIGGASDDTTYAPTYRQTRMLSQQILEVSLADASIVLAYVPDIG